MNFTFSKKFLFLATVVTFSSYTLALVTFQNKSGPSDYTRIDLSTSKGSSVSGTSYYMKTLNTWSMFNPKTKKCYEMKSVQASVMFKVKATNITTNQNICNQNLNIGDKIKLQFLAEKGSEACWNTTGFSLDSPCGEFKDNAAPPTNINDPKYILDNTSLGRYNSGIVTTPFMINPPDKTISGLSGMDCNKVNEYTYNCTITESGKHNIRFNFDETYAKTYTNLNISIPASGGTQLRAGGNGYDRTVFGGNTCSGPEKFVIPSSYINCPITVSGDTTSNKPQEPIISSNNVACLLSQPYTISLSSNNVNSVKFGIDWDNNGTVDNYTGFVATGGKTKASYTFSGAEGNKTISVIAVDNQNKVSNKETFSFNCSNEITSCPNGAIDAPYCKICQGNIQLTDSSQTCPRTCNFTNACGQTSLGNVDSRGQCVPVDTVNNNTCITQFDVSTDSVNPNGSVNFDWRVADLPTGVEQKCGFVDLTTPTPRPIPGLQNLDPRRNSATINNIQATTRFCLVCQFYKNNLNIGEAVAHQWVRVIRIGEN